ncbi:anion transporter [Roseiflexus castenholzii]|uniref:anion transporter n=1 Tax=Roseiflexus castenholzii TaxID=120962 RepID=UPI003C7D65C4
MTWLSWLTVVIVVATIAGIAVGRWPWLRADRATIAVVGAAALLACGAITLEAAFEALDLDTLLLLFSMMVLNGQLYNAGFFGVVAQRVVRVAHTPRGLLALIIVASGVLSALFLNDTIALMLTPLVLDTTRALRRNPIPYLIGLATSANVGSAATITGNPQNMIIGNASGIPYATFVAALAPTALIGMAICWLVIVLVYPQEFRRGRFDTPEVGRMRVYRPLLRKVAVVAPVMLALMIAGLPVALAAFLAATALLATRRLRPERIWKTVDWTLLVFFAGLFVVTGSLQVQGVTDTLFTATAPFIGGSLIMFGIVTALLSNLISNVPAVLVLQHLIPALAQPERGWLMLAAASTLAGNLTLIGSVANLIVAELAARWGVRLTFGAYLRAGVPITVLTLLVAFVLV